MHALEVMAGAANPDFGVHTGVNSHIADSQCTGRFKYLRDPARFLGIQNHILAVRGNDVDSVGPLIHGKRSNVLHSLILPKNKILQFVCTSGSLFGYKILQPIGKYCEFEREPFAKPKNLDRLYAADLQRPLRACNIMGRNFRY